MTTAFTKACKVCNQHKSLDKFSPSDRPIGEAQACIACDKGRTYNEKYDQRATFVDRNDLRSRVL